MQIQNVKKSVYELVGQRTIGGCLAVVYGCHFLSINYSFS